MSSILLMHYFDSSNVTKIMGVRKLYIDIKLQGMDQGKVKTIHKRKFKEILPVCANVMTRKT